MVRLRETLRDVYLICQDLHYIGVLDSPHHLFHGVLSIRSLASLLHRIIINHDPKQLCDHGVVQVYFDCPVSFDIH